MSDLAALLEKNVAVWRAVQGLHALELPEAYVGAGCVAQTVWNRLHGYPPQHGIKDIDIVYFDGQDLSIGAEQAALERAAARFPDLAPRLDVKNEARVHLWYEARFGFPIAPYQSVEDAIGSWPSTATAIGVRIETGRFRAFAPFGLDDLWGGIIRPNKRLITREIYEAKANAWRAKWPDLRVYAWADE